MARKAYHPLSYLRAQTSRLHTTTLQDDLKEAAEALPTVEMRQVIYFDKLLTGTILEERNGMIVLQFVASVPGEQASTLPTKNIDKQQVALGTMDAPEGHDFSDGDLICLVQDDDIFVCCSAMRDDMLYPFLVRLFEKMGKDVQDDNWALGLVRGANKNVMNHIQKYGIKSIQLTATTNAQALSNYSAKEDGNFLQRFFARDLSLLENVKSSGAKVCLTISRTRFNRANFEWLEAEAQTILTGDADYVIETMDNQVFKPNDMIIRQRKQFTPFGKSVFLEEAVEKLKEFRCYVQDNG